MMHTATYHPLLHHRRERAFFLTRATRQVKSPELVRELRRAAAALGALAAWSALAALLVA
jgi:hypothetical protein